MNKLSLGEFELIEKYFQKQKIRQDIIVGIGDDAALIAPPVNHQMAVSMDTLVEGVHFFSDIPAKALGHKALAVNLSDMAAMGAEPRWLTLGLTLPEVDEAWIKAFCEGFFELAEFYNVSLIGGDTTRGPITTITVNVQGVLPYEKALLRDQAFPGDWLYVTGSLGDSALALAHLQGKLELSPEHLESCLQRHYYPQPRVLTGYGLRDIASAAIDISDGLYNDLAHILKASGCGTRLNVAQLPLSEAVKTSVDRDQAIHLALNGGEDYELCFTVPEQNRGSIETALSYSGVPFTAIGQLCSGQGNIILHDDGKDYDFVASGWDHFKSN